MMLERWYRTATALPYIFTIICGAVARLTDTPAAVNRLLTLIAVAGLFAAIPYTLYLVALLTVFRPRTGSDYRRAALLAPLVIAIPFGIVETAIEASLAAPPGILLRSIAVYCIAALAVGYAYVAIVEFVATMIRMRG